MSQEVIDLMNELTEAKAERTKLIGALENVLRNAECETSKHYAVENCAEKGVENPCEVCRARAVLTEVNEQGG